MFVHPHFSFGTISQCWLAVVAPTVALMAAAPAIAAIATITTANADIRAGPGTQYRVMATLNRGTKVEIITSIRRGTHTWYKIVERPRGGGWVREDMLQISNLEPKNSDSLVSIGQWACRDRARNLGGSRVDIRSSQIRGEAGQQVLVTLTFVDANSKPVTRQCVYDAPSRSIRQFSATNYLVAWLPTNGIAEFRK